MRKTLMVILVLLVFVLPLSAYSINVLKNSQQKQSSHIQSTTTIRQNQLSWKKQIKNADVIDSDEFEGGNSFVATSLDQLKNHSKSVIKGTVYKLDKMNSPKNMAYTKASVHIDQVISGDESLKNKTVYLALVGGLVSFDHWYANVNRPKDLNHEMLVKNEQAPLPKIGSRIITGVIPNTIDEPTDYNEALRQSGFTISNSYAIDNLKYNFWVKNRNSKKFILNNPKARKQTMKNDNLAEALENLTSEINKKYNH